MEANDDENKERFVLHEDEVSDVKVLKKPTKQELDEAVKAADEWLRKNKKFVK